MEDTYECLHGWMCTDDNCKAKHEIPNKVNISCDYLYKYKENRKNYTCYYTRCPYFHIDDEYVFYTKYNNHHQQEINIRICDDKSNLIYDILIPNDIFKEVCKHFNNKELNTIRLVSKEFNSYCDLDKKELAVIKYYNNLLNKNKTNFKLNIYMHIYIQLMNMIPRYYYDNLLLEDIKYMIQEFEYVMPYDKFIEYFNHDNMNAFIYLDKIKKYPYPIKYTPININNKSLKDLKELIINEPNNIDLIMTSINSNNRLIRYVDKLTPEMLIIATNKYAHSYTNSLAWYKTLIKLKKQDKKINNKK